MFSGKFVAGTQGAEPAFALRKEVFVDEQGFPAGSEIDDADAQAHHLMIFVEGACIATGRLIMEAPGEFRIGRICVRKEDRGEGYGDLVMRLLIDRAMQCMAKTVHLHAQLPVVPFYQKYGFLTEGEPFDEEGQPHIAMIGHTDRMIFPRKCKAMEQNQ